MSNRLAGLPFHKRLRATSFG
ncbi:hypothetical protein RSAG8_03951, partial [Rhizoctonia solani AG-8 WAC10335]